MAGDLVEVPRELIKLHKDVFMTADVFFINGIPFFISLSYNIILTAVKLLTDRKDNTLFNYFKEIYMYYIKRGFLTTILHVDGKFSILQALIHKITGGPRVNLSSANEDVPNIERQIWVAN